MGCWNGTCFLTNLPILHGDPIVLIPITKLKSAYKEGHAGFCYVDDLYTPASLPIFGEYDDYGGIENMEKYPENHLDIVLEQLKRMISIAKLKYVKRDGSTEDVIFSDLPSLLDRIERDRIERLGFVMIHRSVYDHIAADGEPEEYVFDSDGKYAGTESMRTRIPKNFEKLVTEYKALDESNFERELLFATSDFSRYFAHNVGEWAFRDIVKFYIAAGEPESFKDLMTNFIIFRMMLQRGRRAWLPNTGKGSQDDSTNVQVLIAEETIKLANKINHRWDEEEDID